MKRRDALKLIPLSLAGMTKLRGKPQVASTAGTNQGGHSIVAEVKLHQGTPTLFLDGRPVFAGIYWVATPATDKWVNADQARRAAEAGIHIYAFEAGSGFDCRIRLFPS